LRYLVTGCAGFVGSHLTERLLSDGHTVVGFDNFSTGQEQFLQTALKSPRFTLVRADLSDSARLADSMRHTEFVFHLAANADVRFGIDDPGRDLEQNTLGTHAVLRAMRANGIARIAFASSGSVYGHAALVPTPENAPFPVQTSFYGASKAAAEGLICAHCTGFGLQAYIFRFVSILGERYTHGHIIDFYQQLLLDPTRLRVLGDGRQRKSYLYVHDCIDAMFAAIALSKEQVNIFNLGLEASCEVNDSIGWICAALNLTPAIEYDGGSGGGWIGDNPLLVLDTAKIRATGWSPKVTIQDGVLRTLEYLRTHPVPHASRP
jgi:UDP-glucose 4-epimerase